MECCVRWAELGTITPQTNAYGVLNTHKALNISPLQDTGLYVFILSQQKPKEIVSKCQQL